MKLTTFLALLFLALFSSDSFAQSKRESYFESLNLYETSCNLSQSDEYLRNRAANCFQLARLLETDDGIKKSKFRSYAKKCVDSKEKSKLCNYKSTIDIYEKACSFGEKQSCTEEVYTRLVTRCDGGHDRSCKLLEKGIVNYDEDKSAILLLYTSLFLFGLSVLIITKTMFQDEDEFKAGEKLEEAGSKKDTATDHGIVLRYSRPFFKRYVSPIVSTMKSKKQIRERYKRKLATAGLTSYLTPEDFFSFKLFLIIGFPLVFLGVRAFMEENWSLNLIPIMGFAGFFYPDIWIKGKIDSRQKEILMNMPFSVDMLALSVIAGVDFVAAMSKVVEKAKPSALSSEYEILLREIKIGASRADALRNLAWRIDTIQISSFCATLIAADSVGASIGPILKSLSVEIRQKRSSEIEKAGATAATKILFPMIFFIVPAVMLIVAAPLVLDMMTGSK